MAALIQQLLDDVDRWRFTDVISPALERQTENADLLPPEVGDRLDIRFRAGLEA